MLRTFSLWPSQERICNTWPPQAVLREAGNTSPTALDPVGPFQAAAIQPAHRCQPILLAPCAQETVRFAAALLFYGGPAAAKATASVHAAGVIFARFQGQRHVLAPDATSSRTHRGARTHDHEVKSL